MLFFFFTIQFWFLSFFSTQNDFQNTIPSIQNKKGVDPVIIKKADFISIGLEVSMFSKDSVIVKTILKNDGNVVFLLYKPLLPYDNNNSEQLFSVLENRSLMPVLFLGKSKENHLSDDGSTTSYIIPRTSDDNFVHLKPGQILEITSNIARKYLFKKPLSKKRTQFSIIYGAFFPYVVNKKQVVELDTVDNKRKPVYYLLGPKENKDPELMRVSFTIPR